MSISPNPIDLTTVAVAKAQINNFKSNSSADDILQRHVTAVSRDVVRYTGHRVDPNPASPTAGMSALNAVIRWREVYDGNGSTRMFLDNVPIRTLNAVQIGNISPPIISDPTNLGAQGVYIERDGYSIALRAGFGQVVTTVGWPAGCSGFAFATGRGNILADYDAGWGIPETYGDSVIYLTPDDLELAVCQIIALYYMRRDRVGLSGESINQMTTTTYTKYDWPPEAAEVINRYTRVAVQ